ncbi:hypothetical protein D3C73_1034640 [compost metagenome]
MRFFGWIHRAAPHTLRDKDKIAFLHRKGLILNRIANASIRNEDDYMIVRHTLRHMPIGFTILKIDGNWLDHSRLLWQILCLCQVGDHALIINEIVELLK